MSINYTYWKWKKDDYVNLKSNINADYTINNKDIKDEIEKEIIHIEENKREICNERIINRDMIIQSSINPFLLNNNYIDDLEDQERFLRPKDSNVKKKKKPDRSKTSWARNPWIVWNQSPPIRAA